MLLMNKIHLYLLVCLSCKSKNEVPTESRRLRLKCFSSRQDPSDTTTLSRHGRGFFPPNYIQETQVCHVCLNGFLGLDSHYAARVKTSERIKYTRALSKTRWPHIQIFFLNTTIAAAVHNTIYNYLYRVVKARRTIERLRYRV